MNEMSVREGMEKAKDEGKHVSRPARFMFLEDIQDAPKGRCILTSTEGYKTVTMVRSEGELMDYARKGYSINYVAKNIFGIPTNVLLNEMKLTDPDNPRSRAKGMKDRFSEYMRLYDESRKRDRTEHA